MKPRNALSMLLILSLSALDAGCTEGSYELVLAYPDEAAFNAARWVELHISTDACQALQAAGRAPEHEFDPHGELPAPGALEYGAVSFLARVRDESCRTFLKACVAVQMKQGEVVTVRIPLELTDGASCAANEQCAGGPCLSVDAAVVDAASPDVVGADATAADAGGQDAASPDAAGQDASGADAATADAAIADSASQDMGSPDVALEDAATACVPSTRSCEGATLIVCDAVGQISDSIPCDYGCNASTEACNACAPSTTACQGNTVVVCAGDGQPASTTDCGLTSEVCITDQCLSCTPDTVECQGDLLATCDTLGQASTEDCRPHGCNAGALPPRCNLCTPDSTWCEDANNLATCRSDGSGYDTSLCADGCNDVRDECNACAPDAIWCQTSSVLATCAADGSGYGSEDCTGFDPCSSNSSCNTGQCVLGTVDLDFDGDGFYDDACPGGTDCDDDDYDVNTDASEGPDPDPTCTDQKDNDCDGRADRAAPLCSGSLVDIYRSVGPGNTAPLATGGGNSLVIAADVATFASPLPSDVGVGDALQYDSDDDGAIDAVAFIAGLNSGSEALVQGASGGLPLPTDAADSDWAILRAYTALSSAINGVENAGVNAAVRDFDHFSGGLDLTGAGYYARWNIACYGDGVDSTAVVVDGWVTGPETYLRIYTPTSPAEVRTSQRHEGRWRDDLYRLEPQREALRVFEDYTVIEGLQILAEPGSDGIASAVHIDMDVVGVTVSHTLGGFDSSAANQMRGFYDDGIGSKIFNNVAFGATSDTALTVGFYHHNTEVSFFFNNTAVNCRTGFITYAGEMDVRNCAALGGDVGFGTSNGGTFATSSDYNLSSYGDAPGPRSAGGDVELIDVPARDFRLAPRDVFARDRGANLSAGPDLSFPDDLEGDTRGAVWDIGADEYTGGTAHAVRSVGPGRTSALVSGGPGADLAVSGTLAALGVSMPLNVGVGDVLQYDADDDGALDSIAIVYGRLSPTRLVVHAPEGGVPTPTDAPDQDWAILRAYTSLAAALDGDENSGIDAGLSNFDDWSGGRDISTGGADEVWDIACYGGNADTTAASTAGWETGPANDLRIFTPVGSHQVGESQRHDGVWSDSAYRLVVSGELAAIDVKSAHLTLSGLQLHITSSDTWSCVHVDGVEHAGVDLRVSHSILRGSGDSGSSAEWHSGLELYDFGSGEVRIWNNIFYDFEGTGDNNCGINLFDASYTAYVYNNTIASCGCGLNDNDGRSVARNNLVYACTDNYIGTPADGSNNLSGPIQTDAPGADAINGVTVSFVNSAAGDYRLSAADLNAANAGAALDNDPDLPFDDDIEGESRPYNSYWDVGADEYRP